MDHVSNPRFFEVQSYHCVESQTVMPWCYYQYLSSSSSVTTAIWYYLSGCLNISPWKIRLGNWEIVKASDSIDQRSFPSPLSSLLPLWSASQWARRSLRVLEQSLWVRGLAISMNSSCRFKLWVAVPPHCRCCFELRWSL